MTNKGKERQMKERGNDGWEMTLYSSHSRELTSSESLEKPMRPGLKEGWGGKKVRCVVWYEGGCCFCCKVGRSFSEDRLGLL